MKFRRFLAVVMAVLVMLSAGIMNVAANDSNQSCYGDLELMLYYARQSASVDGANYTTESLDYLNETIRETEDMLARVNVSEDEVQAQIEKLRDAMDNLKTPDINTEELAALIAEAQRIRDEAEYTEASLEQFGDAYTDALMACLYGQTQDEVDRAYEALSAAIEALVVVPSVSEGEVEIPFTLVQECRIKEYSENSQSLLYLVKSPEQFDAVLESINGSPEGMWEPRPARAQKYDDEYFSENALVIGLYEFPSGSIRHSIERLAVNGSNLTVHRIIRNPMGGTDDMQWRYALMEVRLSDVEGIETLDDRYTETELEWNEKVYGLAGDVNNDGIVNIKDATAVQKHAAELHTLFSANLFLADTNADSGVNIKDATEIQKSIAGISTEGVAGQLTKVCMPVFSYETESALVELYETILIAESAIDPGSNFVSSTVRRLSEELDKAEKLYSDRNPRYNQITEQTAALRAAIDGLEYVSIDISELSELMNRAQELIDSGLYTEASVEALVKAQFNAQMVCLYGQSQSEVAEAISELNSAIDALETVSIEYGYIPYEILESCRIDSFGDYDKAVFLIESPEEMDSVLSTISEGFNKRPVRDVSMDDEYFNEKTLIISMGLVGGSCCSQAVNNLERNGDTLTLRRTLYQKVPATPDMNYQYVLIEVDKKNIAGVEHITEIVDVHTTVDSGSSGDNDLPKDTITVYFTNNRNWSDPYIYYWGETEGPWWPGQPMEYLTQNDYGQDVYYFEIPLDVEGIIFSDAATSVQTVDLYDMKDGWGYYLTDQIDTRRWEVASYQYEDFEPMPLPTGEPVPPTDNTNPTESGKEEGEEIPFFVAQKSRVQGWGDIYETEEQELYVVRNVAEFESVLSRIKGSPDDDWEPRPVRDEVYNDEFFMSKSLVVCLYPLGSGSYTYSTDELTVSADTLTIHRTIYVPSVSTCDMNYQYALIEVDASDVSQVKNLNVRTTERWMAVEW